MTGQSGVKREVVANMGAGWMKIQEWARRLGMGRYKYTLSYDSGDQENAAVCGILSALGNKRSAVIKALLMDAVKRYGQDVFNKENVRVLLYLIEHTEMTGTVKQLQSGPDFRLEQGFTFPTGTTGKKRRVSAKKQVFTEGDGLRNAEHVEEPKQNTKAAGIGAEDTSKSDGAAAETGNSPGSGTLMDFLNVGIFEGQ